MSAILKIVRKWGQNCLKNSAKIVSKTGLFYKGLKGCRIRGIYRFWEPFWVLEPF